MSDSGRAEDIFREAARLNREDPLLSGAMLRFPGYGQLVMTGDLHGHTRNFERLQHFCDLGQTPVRHVVLHELIHEEPAAPDAPDMSHLLLLEAARWKVQFPEQVHFLQSNHELSQLTAHEITKGGRVVNRDFERGIEHTYNSRAGDVLSAIMEFLLSYPLAGRTQNRVFISHSLPSDNQIETFDPEDLRKPISLELLQYRPTPYSLVWGRYQSRQAVSTMAAILDADLFICGHQPQEDGYAVMHGQMLILASDHNHGVFLPFDLRRDLTMADLTGNIRPFAAIA
jgi:serine/threonine-protein phosphatase PP1 catalytic subunit